MHLLSGQWRLRLMATERWPAVNNRRAVLASLHYRRRGEEISLDAINLTDNCLSIAPIGMRDDRQRYHANRAARHRLIYYRQK